MIKQIKDGFMPLVAIPPGETIREVADSLFITKTELATKLGITTKQLDNLLDGEIPITNEIAIDLENITGVDRLFWINLEDNYQLDLKMCGY